MFASDPADGGSEGDDNADGPADEVDGRDVPEDEEVRSPMMDEELAFAAEEAGPSVTDDEPADGSNEAGPSVMGEDADVSEVLEPGMDLVNPAPVADGAEELAEDADAHDALAPTNMDTFLAMVPNLDAEVNQDGAAPPIGHDTNAVPEPANAPMDDALALQPEAMAMDGLGSSVGLSVQESREKEHGAASSLPKRQIFIEDDSPMEDTRRSQAASALMLKQLKEKMQLKKLLPDALETQIVPEDVLVNAAAALSSMPSEACVTAIGKYTRLLKTFAT